MIGAKVKRNTTDYLANVVGTVIEIEGSRARVQWPNKRTWYAIANLIVIGENDE